MDKRLIYFVSALLVLVLAALSLSIRWAASQPAQSSSSLDSSRTSPTLDLDSSASVPAATQPFDSPTRAVTVPAGIAESPTVVPTVAPTPLPTLAPQAAATALNLYQPQLAAQGGDPNFRIVIPAIGVDAGIASLGWHTESQNGQLLAVWDDPQYAVGYIINSVVPGASGNTVMIGHNNIFGAVFRKLAELKRGATIEVLFQGERYAFTVTEVKILKETGATPEQQAAILRYFDPTPDTRLTLLSCWPESGNTHRVVVVAKP